MNERIKELEKQAWEFVDKTWNWANANNPSQATLFKAKFAELIVAHATECVRDVLREEDSELTYTAAAQVQNRIKEFFGVEE